MYSGDGMPAFSHDKILTLSDKELDTWIDKIKFMIGRTDNEKRARSLEIELCYLQREVGTRMRMRYSEPRIARPRLQRRV